MRKLCLTLMTISVFLVACGRSEERTRGMVVANAGAIQEARKIQSLLAQTKRCPVELEGWTRSANSHEVELEIWLGTKEERFPMWLDCHEDLSFTIVLKYDMDSGTWVSGGETGALEIAYGHFTAIRTLEISSSDDSAEIAARVVREQ
jgi:hypothetical protein